MDNRNKKKIRNNRIFSFLKKKPIAVYVTNGRIDMSPASGQTINRYSFPSIMGSSSQIRIVTRPLNGPAAAPLLIFFYDVYIISIWSH